MSESIHAGHRQRLKDKYLKCGVDALSDHELLEILLYYAIPQRNTNDIAHELIDKCGISAEKPVTKKINTAATEDVAAEENAETKKRGKFGRK